jgi:signal transduction histidine kinase
MAARCRAFDWAATPLGPVAGWPASLHTLAAVVLAARQPMFLWWGPALVQLYNDAYRPSLGADRHPAALGAQGRVFWADAWPAIGADIERILAGGPAAWYEDRLVPIVRDGRVQDVYWTYGYTPVPDDAGRVAGVLVTVIETTARVEARAADAAWARGETDRTRVAALAASEARFRTVQDASPLGFAIHRPVRAADGAVVDFTLPYVNAAGARIVGQPIERLLGGTVLGIWPGTGPEGVFADYVRVLETGEPHHREVLYEHDELAAGLALTVVRIGEGADAEIGVTFAEVTARLRADRERARLLAESEAARAAADLERRRLATVLEQLPVGVALAEAPSGHLVLSNAAVRRIWGVDTPPAGGDDHSADYAGYHTGPRQEVGRPYASHEWPLARALTLGETVTDEVIEIQRPDGTRRMVSVSAAPVRDADAHVVGGVVISLDVTERAGWLAESERARAEAEAARAQSEAVLASIADPFILVDRDWRITHVNDAAEPPLRTGRGALLGRTVWEAFPGLEGSVFEPSYRDAMATGRPTAVEGYYAPHDSWFDVHVYPWAGGLMVHFRDVSARRQAEVERERLLAGVHGANDALRRMAAEAQAAERRARFLANLGQALQPVAEPDAVMETTARLLGEHLGADRCAYAEVEADEDTFTITGNYTRGDTHSIVGRFTFRAFGAEVLRLMRANTAYVVHDADADPRVTPPDRAAYEATQIRAVICVPLHKAGRFVAAMAVHQRTPRAWTAAEVELVVTVVQRCWEALERARALRRLRESEAALRAASSQLAERTAAAEAARRAAEEANRAKGAFLSTMSHELRTPLNAIGGYAELLALGVRGPVTDAQRLDLDRLRSANRHMTGLVEAVLNFARVDAGQVEYQRDSVPLGPLVADLEALVGRQFAAKGLAYDHDGCGPETPDHPHVVRADAEKVRQVLLNLLTNAVKFTDAGGRVALACETDAAAGVVRVRVSDTGRGIAADQLERVFEPFVQVDRQRTPASQQGLGLGLAISRDLARGMGGDLTAESTPGRGSTFTLTLPAA